MKILMIAALLLSVSPAFAAKINEASFRQKQKLVQLIKQDDAVAGALRGSPQKFCKMTKVNATEVPYSHKLKQFDFNIAMACQDQTSQTVINATGTVLGKKVINLTLTRQSEG